MKIDIKGYLPYILLRLLVCEIKVSSSVDLSIPVSNLNRNVCTAYKFAENVGIALANLKMKASKSNFEYAVDMTEENKAVSVGTLKCVSCPVIIISYAIFYFALFYFVQCVILSTVLCCYLYYYCLFYLCLIEVPHRNKFYRFNFVWRNMTVRNLAPVQIDQPTN